MGSTADFAWLACGRASLRWAGEQEAKLLQPAGDEGASDVGSVDALRSRMEVSRDYVGPEGRRVSHDRVVSEQGVLGASILRGHFAKALEDRSICDKTCLCVHPRFVAVGTTSGAVALFRVPATGPDAAGDVQAALDANHAGRDAAAVLGDGKSGPLSVCSCLCASPDGAWVVSGHTNGALTLWDQASGTVLRTTNEHRSHVTALAFLPLPGAPPTLLSGDQRGGLVLTSFTSMPLLRIVQATSRVVTELGLAEGVLQVAAAGQAPGVDGGSHPPQVAVCAVAVATPSGVHLLQVAARAGQAVPAGLAIRALQTRARPPDVPEGRPPCVAWRPAECAPLPRELRGMGAEEGARAEDAGEAPGWQLVVGWGPQVQVLHVPLREAPKGMEAGTARGGGGAAPAPAASMSFGKMMRMMSGRNATAPDPTPTPAPSEVDAPPSPAAPCALVCSFVPSTPRAPPRTGADIIGVHFLSQDAFVCITAVGGVSAHSLAAPWTLASDRAACLDRLAVPLVPRGNTDVDGPLGARVKSWAVEQGGSQACVAVLCEGRVAVMHVRPWRAVVQEMRAAGDWGGLFATALDLLAAANGHSHGDSQGDRGARVEAGEFEGAVSVAARGMHRMKSLLSPRHADRAPVAESLLEALAAFLGRALPSAAQRGTPPATARGSEDAAEGAASAGQPPATHGSSDGGAANGGDAAVGGGDGSGGGRDTAPALNHPESSAGDGRAEVEAAECADTAVALCVASGRVGDLFSRVFPLFQSHHVSGPFLPVLAAYIEAGAVASTSAEVFSALVTYFQEQGRPDRVERCVLRMHPASVDFDQVARLCRRHRLHAALAHLFLRGLADAVTPAAAMLADAACDDDPPRAARVGRRLLALLACAARGEWFPPSEGKGAPPEAGQGARMRADAAATLLQGTRASLARHAGMGAADAARMAEAAPVARALWGVDAPASAALLAVVAGAGALPRAAVEGALGAEAVAAAHASRFPSSPSPPDPLPAETVAQAVAEAVWAWVQAGVLPTEAGPGEGDAAAVWVAGEGEGEGGDEGGAGAALGVDGAWAGRVLAGGAFARAGAGAGAGAEAVPHPAARALLFPRLSAVAQLLWWLLDDAGCWLPPSAAALAVSRLARAAGGQAGPAVAWAESRCLSLLARQARGWQAAGSLRESAAAFADAAAGLGSTAVEAAARHLAGDAAGAVAAGLRADACPSLCFQYLRAAAGAPPPPDCPPLLPPLSRVVELAREFPLPRDQLGEAFLQHASQMTQVDASASASLVASVFPGMQGSLIKHLDPFPEVQYKYLRGTASESTAMDRDTCDQYVRLLCRFAPFDVLPFLLSHDAYSLPACLDACRAHRVKGAVTYLLERMGDVEGATRLAGEDVAASIAALAEAVTGGEVDAAAERAAGAAAGVGPRGGAGAVVQRGARPWEYRDLLSAVPDTLAIGRLARQCDAAKRALEACHAAVGLCMRHATATRAPRMSEGVARHGAEGEGADGWGAGAVGTDAYGVPEGLGEEEMDENGHADASEDASEGEAALWVRLMEPYALGADRAGRGARELRAYLAAAAAGMDEGRRGVAGGEGEGVKSDGDKWEGVRCEAVRRSLLELLELVVAAAVRSVPVHRLVEALLSRLSGERVGAVLPALEQLLVAADTEAAIAEAAARSARGDATVAQVLLGAARAGPAREVRLVDAQEAGVTGVRLMRV